MVGTTWAGLTQKLYFTEKKHIQWNRVLQVRGHWSDCIELMGGNSKMDIFNVGWIKAEHQTSCDIWRRLDSKNDIEVVN